MSLSIAARASCTSPFTTPKTRQTRSHSWPQRETHFPSASPMCSRIADPASPPMTSNAPARSSRSPAARPSPIRRKPMAWSNASTVASQAKFSVSTSPAIPISKRCSPASTMPTTDDDSAFSPVCHLSILSARGLNTTGVWQTPATNLLTTTSCCLKSTKSSIMPMRSHNQTRPDQSCLSARRDAASYISVHPPASLSGASFFRSQNRSFLCCNGRGNRRVDSIFQNGTWNLLACRERPDEFCRGLWRHAFNDVHWHWLLRHAAFAGIRCHALAP